MPEFICDALEEWAAKQEPPVQLHFIKKGKPTQNAFVESFHSIMRRELLNAECFRMIHEAREAIASWVMYYNDEREHGSLNDLPPSEFEEMPAAGGSQAYGLLAPAAVRTINQDYDIKTLQE